jgi:hypothetical protein
VEPSGFHRPNSRKFGPVFRECFPNNSAENLFALDSVLFRISPGPLRPLGWPAKRCDVEHQTKVWSSNLDLLGGESAINLISLDWYLTVVAPTSTRAPCAMKERALASAPR